MELLHLSNAPILQHSDVSMNSPGKRFKRMVVLLLAVLGLSYLGVVLAMVAMQRSFIYFPDNGTEAELVQLARQSGLQSWRDGQGQLIGWKSAAHSPPPANRLLILHGNAGQAADRDYLMQGWTQLGGGKLWEVFVLEYPGFGARAGHPSEAAIMAAAEAALQQLLQSDRRPLFLLGESLGSGVASQLAGRHPEAIGGVLLVTPFTSLVDIAAGQHPYILVRLLLRDRYESDQALQKYRGRLTVLLGGRDTIVPTRFGQRLYDGYDGPKRLWIQPEAGHNNLDYQPAAAWWREVSDFLLQPASTP